MVTVRIPRSLHEALRVEAHEHCTSMNKLCISKLLQFIDKEMVPTETPGSDGAGERGDDSERVGSGPISRVLCPAAGRSRSAEAMAISLGSRLLGPSSGLPGSRCGPDQPAGLPAATKCGRQARAPCLTLLLVGFA